MARLAEELRLPMINSHIAHWGQVNSALPTPLLIAGTYGIASLEADRDAFETLFNEVVLLRDTLLPAQRAQRDGAWGLTLDDPDGVWFKLKGYRPLVKSTLRPRHPLARTIPNFLGVTPRNYVPMCRAFADHWTQVNAGLGATPLVLGPFTLANLQTVITNLETLLREIDENELLLAVKREKLEQLFGDEPEDVREATSIIARLSLYHAVVLAQFGGQPLGDSLPDIFPPTTSSTLPSFKFNWTMQDESTLKVWYSVVNPEWNATHIFLKEGIDSRLDPITPERVVLWPEIVLLDDIDDVELRNTEGLTVARGNRDETLPEPA